MTSVTATRTTITAKINRQDVALKRKVTADESSLTYPSEIAVENSVHGLRRAVYFTLAVFLFVLAMVGVALPGIPTTPFLLLTSYFLARSSPKMHRTLLANKFARSTLTYWHQHRAIQPHIKARAIVVILVMIVIMFAFSDWPTSQLLGVCALSAIGLLIVYRLPTLPQ